MSKRVAIVVYTVLVLAIFAAIFIIWAIDTGRIAGSADVTPTTTSAQELKTLPNPDNSTFSKIFGRVASWFSR